MAMDMLKRTIELLANSTVSTAKNYFSNADQIVTDSKQIYTGVKDAVKKPVDFVRGMLSRSRGGGIYKLVNDWFYQRSNEFDSFDLGGLDDDDDFDAGFGDNGGDEEEEPSASLDTKAMKDIARGQVGAMYQIGQKQTEASLANTAEIVTTFNSRSSEIVAAITNMTKSIINIDKNLTTLSLKLIPSIALIIDTMFFKRSLFAWFLFRIIRFDQLLLVPGSFEKDVSS